MKKIIEHLNKEMKEISDIVEKQGGFDKETLELSSKFSKIMYNLHYAHKHPIVEKHNHEESIEDELMGCGEYIEKYEETKDEKYLCMAKDELKHAGMLIDMYPESENNYHEQHERLNHYKKRLNEVEVPESPSLLMKYK